MTPFEAGRMVEEELPAIEWFGAEEIPGRGRVFTGIGPILDVRVCEYDGKGRARCNARAMPHDGMAGWIPLPHGVACELFGVALNHHGPGRAAA